MISSTGFPRGVRHASIAGWVRVQYHDLLMNLAVVHGLGPKPLPQTMRSPRASGRAPGTGSNLLRSAPAWACVSSLSETTLMVALSGRLCNLAQHGARGKADWNFRLGLGRPHGGPGHPRGIPHREPGLSWRHREGSIRDAQRRDGRQVRHRLRRALVELRHQAVGRCLQYRERGSRSASSRRVSTSQSSESSSRVRAPGSRRRGPGVSGSSRRRARWRPAHTSAQFTVKARK